jgi:serine/threonine protein kinase/WD40 repeat protein
MKKDDTHLLDQVREIFLQALEKSTHLERNAFLDGACGGNPDLRSNVDELLANHLQDSFLERSPVEEDTMVSDSVKLTESTGTIINRYKLLQQIGEGGMGAVFMAEQTEPVRRNVALKIIKLGMDTKSVVARFEAERQALALMDHPNIAKVLDAGTTETGRPYFVMELVKGVPINTYSDKNHLNTRERLELFAQVCKSIQHAHQKGVIHREIKPSNILVTLHDGKPVPKVIDFGIAKATNQRLTEKTLFTNFAQMIGTPAYMSPEQAEMSGLDVDTRTDVYSLGVLLYELLTGSTPFLEKELLSEGYGEMQRIIAEKEPDRPSFRMSTLIGKEQTIIAKNRSGEFGSLTKQMRGDLDWIVMKALEKDRTRRYETANGLAEDIRRHLEDEPVMAGAPTFAYRWTKFFRRHRKPLIAAALVTGGFYLMGMMAAYQAVRATNAEQQANLARDAEIRVSAFFQEERDKAIIAEEEAKRNEKEARQLLYAADMRDASRAMDEEDFGQAKRLMQRQSSYKIFQGWEWRHLWLKTHGTKHKSILKDHKIHTHSFSISSDGRLFAAGTASLGNWKALSVWDLNSEKLLPDTPEVRSGRVRTAFSPIENLLAYNSQESPEATTSRVHLWNADTSESVFSFLIDGTCEGLTFTSDGQTLMVANEVPKNQSKIILWDLKTEQEISSIPAPGFRVHLGLWESFATDHLGHYAVYGAGRETCIVNLQTGDTVKTLPTGGGITAVSISPDGSLAVIASGYSYDADYGPVLWDLASGERLGVLSGHTRGVSEIVFWPDGNRLATSSMDQTVRIWDISKPRKPKMNQVLRGHQSGVSQLILAPDQKTLISGSAGEAIAWNTESKSALPEELNIEEIRNAGWAFANNGEALISVEESGVIRRTGTEFQHRETLIEFDEKNVNPYIRFSGNAKYLLMGSEEGMVTLYNLKIGKKYSQKVGEGIAGSTLVQNDGLVVLVNQKSPDDRFFYLETHDLAQGKVLHSVRLFGGMQPFAAVSPDGNFFVRTNDSSDLGALFVDRSEGGREILITDALVWTRACFSPDGSLLAMRSHAQRIQGAVHVQGKRI